MATDPLTDRSRTVFQRQKGITLLELMMVVAVVGILAAIAYPSYQDQMQRSRRSDAKVTLERLSQTLERCYTNSAPPKTYAGCIAASNPTENGYYTIATTTANNTVFLLTATATGPQLKDTKCRTFTLTNTNARRAKTASDADNDAECWRR